MEYFKIDRRGRRTDGDGAGRGRTDGRIVFLRRNPKHLISSANGWTDGRTDGRNVDRGRRDSLTGERRKRGGGSLGGSRLDRTDRQRDAAAPLFILD